MDRTLVQHHTPIMPGLEHPSFPGRTIPAVLDGYEPPDWCVHCAWLARMIRAGRHVEQYGWLAIQHVVASHGGAS